MKKVKLALVCVLFFTSMFICAQSLQLNDLKDGNIYFIDYEYTYEVENIAILTAGNHNNKHKPSYSTITEKVKQIFIYKNGQTANALTSNLYYDSSGDFSYSKGSKNIDDYRKYKINTLRPATKDEIHWLSVCIEEKKTISKEEALKKTTSKNRGEIKSTAIHLFANHRLNSDFKGKKDGFGFSGVTFNYQFVNCGGDVQMGVNVYTDHEYTINGHYRRRGLKVEGYALEGQLYPLYTISASKVDIQEIEADLYFGSQFLGRINLNNIVGNFAGCFGETFDVLKQVGKDPKLKEYKENLSDFELKRIEVLRGDVVISDKERQDIHKSLKYDEYGNPINSNSQTSKKEEQQYDAFGNPTKDTEGESNEQNKPKYDAFGNPIKN